MFDEAINSQSVNPNTIDLTFTTTDRIDTVALLNIAGLSVRIIMTDAIDGVVYDKTTSLISDSGITDWYSYFYEPIARKTDFVAFDLPPYYAATVRVILSDPGYNVAIGALLLGFKKVLGGTQYGAKAGIQDYSVKKRDDFGNYTILERAYNKNASFTFWVVAGNVDYLQNLLATYRATPILYIGTEDYRSTVIYGFYKDFSITIAYPTESLCNLELEGLT
ncbi:carbohydrate-binding protein [Methylomonas sp. ZR1]|nr:carbohydrate-binding protein [Methylomonas sp. ZR1]